MIARIRNDALDNLLVAGGSAFDRNLQQNRPQVREVVPAEARQVARILDAQILHREVD